MLFFLLSIPLLICGSLSLQQREEPQESGKATYGYVLADSEGFAPSMSFLEAPLELRALQERQTFQCNPRSWVQCPNVPGKCKPPSAACCDSNYYYYPQSQTCCPGLGACRKGMGCCPRSCCPRQGVCGSNGLCSTYGIITQTSTRTSSTRSTTTTTLSTTKATNPITTTPTSTSTRASTAYGPCKTPSPAQKIELEERQYPRENFCTEVCHIASGKRMAVLNLKNIPGVTDQLIDSTCRGMRARQAAGQIAKGLNPWEDILQYNGGGKRNRVTNVNCKEFCTAANKAADPNGRHRWAFECDEYPPAAFNQKSNAQTRLCIRSEQNSGTQAPILSDLVRHCKLKKGDNVLFRVDGGCPPPRIKRDGDQEKGHIVQEPADRALQPRQEGATIELSDFNFTVLKPFGDNSLSFIGMPLGDLPDGQYNLDINVGKSVSNVTVMDADGETYANVESPSGSVKLSFDVANDGDYLPLALIAYADETVNVSYTGEGTINSSDSSDSKPSSGHKIAQARYPVVMAIAVTLAALM